MKIDHITTMTRVGSIVLREGSTQRLDLAADAAVTREQLRDYRGRVYAIVVDGEIKKIGGSQDKGGIQGTLSWYFNGFNKGNSERTYCTWNYMWQAIAAGRSVEIYAVWAPLVTVTIPTMTGELTKEMPVDFHTIEAAFNKEYFDLEGAHPELNMQESSGKWADTGLLEGYINKDGTIYGSNPAA